MATAAEIRARIASGQVKSSAGSSTPLPEGNYAVQIESAEYGPGENGSKRGKLVCKVIGAENPANVGKHFNYYIQTRHQEYMERTIAEFTDHCKVWGISEERLYDRADTGEDIIVNLMGEMNRLAIKGLLIGQVERKASGKMSPKGQPLYWINWTKVALSPTPLAVTKTEKFDAPMDPSTQSNIIAQVMESLADKKVTLGDVVDKKVTLGDVVDIPSVADIDSILDDYKAPATVATPPVAAVVVPPTPVAAAPVAAKKKAWEI
jgi:hypothetical protein